MRRALPALVVVLASLSGCLFGGSAKPTSTPGFTDTTAPSPPQPSAGPPVVAELFVLVRNTYWLNDTGSFAEARAGAADFGDPCREPAYELNPDRLTLRRPENESAARYNVLVVRDFENRTDVPFPVAGNRSGNRLYRGDTDPAAIVLFSIFNSSQGLFTIYVDQGRANVAGAPVELGETRHLRYEYSLAAENRTFRATEVFDVTPRGRATVYADLPPEPCG